MSTQNSVITSAASISTEATSTKSLGASNTLLQSGLALVFGAVVLFAVGFMPMNAAHNAAHDTRHALAFPCH